MSPELDWVFYTAIAVLTISNWVGAAGKKRGLYYTTKPLVIVALLLFFSQKGGLTLNAGLSFLALVFSLLGDVFLIPRAMRWFIAGIWAFLGSGSLSLWIQPLPFYQFIYLELA